MECKFCGRQLNVDDVNLATRLAKCRNCQEVFSFGEASRHTRAAVDANVARRPAPRPECIEISDDPVHCIQWRWFEPGLFLQLLFCLVWDGFLVVWYYMAFANAAGQGTQWCMVLFPVLHVAVGLQLTYATIAGFLNRTTITLRIRHGPCPWFGKNVDAAAIEQIYCARGGGGIGVFAVLRGEGRVRLVNVRDEGHAIFLEDQIEGWVGLPDEMVPGELKDRGHCESDTAGSNVSGL